MIAQDFISSKPPQQVKDKITTSELLSNDHYQQNFTDRSVREANPQILLCFSFVNFLSATHNQVVESTFIFSKSLIYSNLFKCSVQD